MRTSAFLTGARLGVAALACCGRRAAAFLAEPAFTFAFAFAFTFALGFAFGALFFFLPALADAPADFAFLAAFPLALVGALFFLPGTCFAFPLLLFLDFGLAMTPHYRAARKRSRHEFNFGISCN